MEMNVRSLLLVLVLGMVGIGCRRIASETPPAPDVDPPPAVSKAAPEAATLPAASESPRAPAPIVVRPRETTTRPTFDAVPIRITVLEDLRDLLRPRTVTAERMEVAPSDRQAELTRRVHEAAAKDPQWWQSYVSQKVPGVVLPYHPKIGLTEEEYHEFARLAQAMELRTVGTTELTVAQAPDERYFFETDPKIDALDGVFVNLRAFAVDTPLGRCAPAQVLAGGPTIRRLGARRGNTWVLEEGNRAEGDHRNAIFELSRTESDGRVVVYYRAERVEDYRTTTDIRLLLLLPAEPE